MGYGCTHLWNGCWISSILCRSADSNLWKDRFWKGQYSHTEMQLWAWNVCLQWISLVADSVFACFGVVLHVIGRCVYEVYKHEYDICFSHDNLQFVKVLLGLYLVLPASYWAIVYSLQIRLEVTQWSAYRLHTTLKSSHYHYWQAAGVPTLTPNSNPKSFKIQSNFFVYISLLPKLYENLPFTFKIMLFTDGQTNKRS